MEERNGRKEAGMNTGRKGEKGNSRRKKVGPISAVIVGLSSGQPQPSLLPFVRIVVVGKK